MYREALEIRLEAAESGTLRLRLPRSSGLRLRLPGMPFHATPEVFLQETGQKVFRFPSEKFVVRPGDVCIVPAGMPHHEVARRRPAICRDVIGRFRADGFSYQFGSASLQETVVCGLFDFFPSSRALRMVRYLEEITAAMWSESKRRAALARGLFTAYLALALEDLSQPARSSASREPLVAHGLDVIDRELGNSALSVAALSRKVGCTPDYLARLFRRELGESPVGLINGKRVAYAREMLEHSSLNVTEVSWAAGFRNASYFNRVFRQRVGMAPSEYKRRVTSVKGFFPRSGGALP